MEFTEQFCVHFKAMEELEEGVRYNQRTLKTFEKF